MSETTYDLSTVSSGVKYLTDGYIDYCEEVIANRALPNIYDGLKPVNRRILVTLVNDKVTKSFMKCARISGNVLALHPHGDASVYAAMVLMTDKNGSLAFPLVDGSGSFGGVYKTDPPAAQRYTEAKISQMALDEYFGEMDGINMIPNFDSTMSEPDALPVSFPAVLVNSTSGIAVGFKSNIPSFNFVDVCNLVKEYIEKGECTTVICPDFVTGGEYVYNAKELKKLMLTGSGKIKLRGKVTITGKEINVTDVPFGKTIQGLVKQINDKNLSSVRNAYDADDFAHGLMFTVDCTAKNRVDEALYAMYKETDFQYTYSADITVVKNGVPVRIGVWNIISEWVAWRKQVLEKEYNVRLENAKQAIREASAFMAVVKDRKRCAELVNTIRDNGREYGRNYVKANFSREEVPEDLIPFVCSRSLPDYHKGGKYESDFVNMSVQVKRLEDDLANLDAVIVKQMDRLIAQYGTKLARKTEITNTDYEFTEEQEEKEKYVDTSKVFYALKNGFLRKCRYDIIDNEAEYKFEGQANDTLIAIDNRGRVLRIYCSDLPINSPTDMGLYLPRYFGFNESEDYCITWISRMQGQTAMIVYKDGNFGFLDTSEWMNNNRNVKVIEKGIATSIADKVGAVIENIPEVLYVSDTKGKIGWVLVDDIKRKDRTAKTRIFNLSKGAELDSYACYSATEGALIMNNCGVYRNTLKNFDMSEFRGEVSDFKDMM